MLLLLGSKCAFSEQWAWLLWCAARDALLYIGRTDDSAYCDGLLPLLCRAVVLVDMKMQCIREVHLNYHIQL